MRPSFHALHVEAVSHITPGHRIANLPHDVLHPDGVFVQRKHRKHHFKVLIEAQPCLQHLLLIPEPLLFGVKLQQPGIRQHNVVDVQSTTYRQSRIHFVHKMSHIAAVLVDVAGVNKQERVPCNRDTSSSTDTFWMCSCHCSNCTRRGFNSEPKCHRSLFRHFQV